MNIALGPHTLLVTPEALPLPDYIIEQSTTGERFFRPYQLERLFHLLEAVVLYEKVVVATCEVESPFAEAVNASDAFHRFAPGWVMSRHAPVAQLSATVREQLTAANVLGEQVVRTTMPARELFDATLAQSTLVQEERHRQEEALGPDVPDPILRGEMAFLLSWTRIGRPLYVAEVARRHRIPHQVGHAESWWITQLEAQDRQRLTGIIAELSRTMNATALADLRRVEELGGTTPFPETPIAAEILHSAATPDDLPRLALQMRAEYRNVRATVQELERALRTDDITLKRKLQIVAEINGVIARLAKHRSIGRDLVETASLLGTLPTALPNTMSAGTAALTGVAALVAKARAAMTQRRYRVLFRAQARFLRTKSAAERLSTIFQLPRETITEGLAEHSAARNRTTPHT